MYLICIRAYKEKKIKKKIIPIRGYAERYIDLHAIKYQEGFTMTFYRYMIDNYYKAEGRKHDLAADMKSDWREFPIRVTSTQPDGHKVIRGYLEFCQACDDCLDVFEECWKEYVQCEKSKSNRNS